MFKNRSLFYSLVAGAAAVAVGVAAYSSWNQEDDVKESAPEDEL